MTTIDIVRMAREANELHEKQMRLLKYLLVTLYFLALGFCVGALVGLLVGHNEACASVRAEWRNDKCVRVVEEEVK